MRRHLDGRSVSRSGVVVEEVEGRLMFAATPPPVVPPPQPPPVPKPGIVLNKGVLAIGGDPKVNNTISVSLSSDHKQINVTVNGKAHSPFAASSVTDVIVAGGPKNDTINIALAAATLKHPVVIFGLDGNDKITAGGERDLIFAGAGNDTVTAGAGNDAVVAGPGKDVVHGGDGNDSLWGDKDDTLDGGSGTNVIHLVPPPPAPVSGSAS
jgi:hypothetical protein